MGGGWDRSFYYCCGFLLVIFNEFRILRWGGEFQGGQVLEICGSLGLEIVWL
jgi:hypothetical protein